MSKTKAVKANIRDKAQYKFKEKGKKPINVSGVANFMITGADFDSSVLSQILESQSVVSLDQVGAKAGGSPSAPTAQAAKPAQVPGKRAGKKKGANTEAAAQQEESKEPAATTTP